MGPLAILSSTHFSSLVEEDNVLLIDFSGKTKVSHTQSNNQTQGLSVEALSILNAHISKLGLAPGLWSRLMGFQSLRSLLAGSHIISSSQLVTLFPKRQGSFFIVTRAFIIITIIYCDSDCSFYLYSIFHHRA